MAKYDINWLLEVVQQPERVKYLFFWGHTPNKDGSIGATCLSQWWMSSFEVDGVVYPSAEHWMMAGKARLFNDEAHLNQILNCKTPAEAKKLGRMVENFDSDIWNANSYNIVVQGSIHKFEQNPELREFLLSTENRVLVEASPRDRIWGIGMGKNNEHAEHPEFWRGTNLLGFALMEARDFLMENVCFDFVQHK